MAEKAACAAVATDRGAPPLLRVKLLGGFSVERADLPGVVSGWQRRSAKSLTKLLAACPQHALHREQILDALWPDADAESALNSFGKALHAARHAFEPDLPRRVDSAYLRLTDAVLMLSSEHVLIDADRFEQLAAEALRTRNLGALESALAAYGGDLLPEDRYEDWCSERRESLAELSMRLLLGLAEQLEKRGAFNESADRLRQVLRKDPTREVVHRRLMRLYAEMGTSDQAVRQYHACREVLRRELNMTPQQETVSLYHDILARRGLDWKPAPEGDRDQAGLYAPQFGIADQDRPFVGRERVLTTLCQQLKRINAGRPGMVLVSGEAGVGKSRLLEELASMADQQGAAVLWGGRRAHANEFACGPFAVALEGYASGLSASERGDLAGRYPVLARFVPSLGPAVPTDVSDCHLDLISATVRLLTDLAAKRPVLVVIGDLQEVDRLSLDLLRYLARLALHRRWLIVAAVRDDESEADTELRRTIEASMRERLCTRIELHCLSRQNCDQLIRQMLPGGEPDSELLDQIYQQSRGNPLFVVELVRQLADTGDLMLGTDQHRDRSRATRRVPARVRALIAMRLAAEDESLRCVLGLAAATQAGEISMSELRTGAAAFEPAVSDAALFTALDRALRMRFLEERNGVYAFRQPLFRSALYEGLPRHRRDQLHAALAGSTAR